MAATRLEKMLDELPFRYVGPGGAVAVLRDGAVLERRSWGWADTERRIPFTAQTMMLVCSITKQFTCSLMLDRFPDPTVLDEDVRRRFPLLEQPAPHTTELSHNQSGLRDYWAAAMLCGAPVEGTFGDEQARRLVEGTRTLQFSPGTRYSYCNQNFRLLSEIVEARAGQPFAELLRERVLAPAGMPHARLAPDTAQVPGGTVGYEGTQETGFRPAVNRIVWTGDAGLAASLDDLIAWEKFIDTTRDDPSGIYNRLSAPATFRGGDPAFYGFGLARMNLHGHAATGHGGGLRGWRSFRFNIPALRISVVMLFNHMADPRKAAMDVLAALLDAPETEPAGGANPDVVGRYHEPETNLAVTIDKVDEGQVRLHYATAAETLSPSGSNFAAGTTVLRPDADGLWLDRATDHQSSLLAPATGEAPRDIEGVFHSAELDAHLTCISAGGALYGAFSGFLGQGAMQALIPFSADTWLLPCPRALDLGAPGDWTLRFRRDAARKIIGVDVGCWLARHVAYERV